MHLGRLLCPELHLQVAQAGFEEHLHGPCTLVSSHAQTIAMLPQLNRALHARAHRQSSPMSLQLPE